MRCIAQLLNEHSPKSDASPIFADCPSWRNRPGWQSLIQSLENEAAILEAEQQAEKASAIRDRIAQIENKVAESVMAR